MLWRKRLIEVTSAGSGSMQNADQMPVQAGRPRGNPTWRPGVSANPRGRETAAERQQRRDAVIASWTGDRSFSPAALVLLQQAADLSMTRPRTDVERTRRANTIARILRQVGVVGTVRRRRSARVKIGGGP
jgi:hypothetical protein